MMTHGGRRDQRGGVLLGTLLILSMLMALGILSLNLATQEVQSTSAAMHEAAARHLAESGVDLIVRWFHDPGSAPPGAISALLAKRYELPEAGPSFFDAEGRSQFTGTVDHPDLSLDASRPEDNRLMNDPVAGWFRALRHLGRIVKLSLYGPARPGLLCSVDVTAEKGGVARTESVQLGVRSLPVLRAGVQVGGGRIGGAVTSQGVPLPLWVHWGDLKVTGDAWLGKSEEVPVKSVLAPVTGLSYADMMHREDRWFDFWIGGEVLVPLSAAAASAEVPGNVHPQQEPIPGLRMDQWDYHAMREAARLFGAYYVRGLDGLLYRDAIMQPGHGRSPDEVFGSHGVGDHRGLVFVDTPDQQPPSPSNLGVLSLEVGYAEGVFIVNAHVSWKPSGLGKPVPALSPPHDGSAGPGARIPVQLTRVNLQGVLYSAGDIVFDGEPRLYGALVADRNVVRASGDSGFLEVWYNDDLRNGLVRGLPLIYPVPGTRQEKY